MTKFINKDGREIELKFDINKEDSLNNRFKEIKDLKTDMVFSIDDDIIFPCASVELAFRVWQSAPDAMVGFVPRVHWVDESVGAFILFSLFSAVSSIDVLTNLINNDML
ncbi:glycosyltransferase [Lithospermum erythrorhizon]|uniref:Glycosyltransferase n=1 Tax=Lithospermum erythrorhizon TaxID=34254 RepID=A0AAV3PN90_LITER